MPQKDQQKRRNFVQVEELTSDEEFVEAEEEHQPQYDSDGDEIPDVDDINIDNKNNRANCINSNIDKVTKSLDKLDRISFMCRLFKSEPEQNPIFIIKVLEVYDEETCMEMMRSYYEVNYPTILHPIKWVDHSFKLALLRGLQFYSNWLCYVCYNYDTCNQFLELSSSCLSLKEVQNFSQCSSNGS